MSPLSAECRRANAFGPRPALTDADTSSSNRASSNTAREPLKPEAQETFRSRTHEVARSNRRSSFSSLRVTARLKNVDGLLCSNLGLKMIFVGYAL